MKLRPCPFCNNQKVKRDEMMDWKAACLGCGAEIPLETWNTRPIEDALETKVMAARVEGISAGLGAIEILRAALSHVPTSDPVTQGYLDGPAKAAIKTAQDTIDKLIAELEAE